jgi:hypothetical protein
LPARDTPPNAEAFPPRPDGLSSAAIADRAAAAWRSVTPSIAGTPHVWISRDGGRTYPARHARPLPTDPPGQPCTVPVYDPGSATGRMLALDLDPARGDVDHQAAELVQLLERLGGRCIADVSPSGGRHVLVLFSSPLPWRELRDVARALSQRFPAVDPAPMSSLGGQISPPGARHKSGGWRTLPASLSEARAAVEAWNSYSYGQGQSTGPTGTRRALPPAGRRASLPGSSWGGRPRATVSLATAKPAPVPWLRRRHAAVRSRRVSMSRRNRP